MTTEEQRLIKLEKDLKTITKAVMFLLEAYVEKPERLAAKGRK